MYIFIASYLFGFIMSIGGGCFMDFIIKKKKGILLILLCVFFIGMLVRYDYGHKNSIMATKLKQIIDVIDKDK